MAARADLERDDARANLAGSARRDLGRGPRLRGGSDGDGEARHGKTRGLTRAQDQLLAGERGEGGLHLARILTDAGDEGFEGGGATSAREAREAEEGAEDGDLGAHGSHYVQH